jgi:hypothetical protein
MLLLIQLLYTLKRKTAEDLVNEFAATLDSLPNKKNLAT